MNKPIVILGKKDSDTAKLIGSVGGFMFNEIPPQPHAFINIGFQGKERRVWDKKVRPNFESVPFLNDWVQIPKYNVVKMVEARGIPTPETYDSLDKFPIRKCEKFVVKNNWNHNPSTFRKLLPDNLPQKGEYIQRIMKDKTHVIRVIGSLWEGHHTWLLWQTHSFAKDTRRITSGMGSSLYSLCFEYADRVLRSCELLFGAVDFIYSKDKRILEFVNMSTCPKIPVRAQKHVKDSFITLSLFLKTKTKKEVVKWVRNEF